MSETAENSLYLREAGPGTAWPHLDGPLRTEVAVIGGGFTGLSTALHLAERGIDVAVFEAEQPGWGASGRNGGQLNPGLKYDPSWFLEHFGEVQGRAIVDFGWSTVEQTAELISRHGIECGLRRNGTLRAAASAHDVAGVRASQADMRAHGMPVDWIEGEALTRLLGHDAYHGAFLDRRGGDLNPLLYARGLARVAQAAGASVFARSRVSALQRSGSEWALQVNGQEVRASRVLIACNGYADQIYPGLRQASVPVFSSVLASEPLGKLAERIMPGRQALYEAGLVTVYCRVDEGGRLIIGGRGPMKPSSDPRRMQAIARHAIRLWPELASVGWQYAWNGRVSITQSHLPHLHAPADGLLIAYGYNGRGVALATAMGERLAEALAGQDVETRLPLPATALKKIRFHRFWPVGVHAAVQWAKLRAALQP